MMKAIEFRNGRKQTLRGYVHVRKKYETALITLHGFPGNCNGKRILALCRQLERNNVLVMRFDFSCTDSSDGRFEDKLMSKEVSDVKYAIDFLSKNFKFRKLILHGHSTGATVASLYAYTDRRISKLILSGATDDLKHAAHYDFTDSQVRDFWTRGYMTYKVKGYWTHNKRLMKAYYDEFFTLDIPRSMKRYKRPLLIIHGTNDEAVPLKDAKALFKNANKPKKLVIIKGADHRFTRRKHVKQYADAIIKFAKS